MSVFLSILFLQSAAQQGPAEAINPVNKSWSQVVNRTDILPEARHEAGFVEFGGKFYLIGGRGPHALNIFNPETKSWTAGAAVPGDKELHHFQAIVFQNKIYVIGAFTHWFPEETPVGDIYIYDPLTNRWTVKANAIPADRRRGATGAVVYNNLIYLVGGIKNGHTDGWVNWTDSYDPITGEWKKLADAPHERDHFHAAVINNKLYAAAGRKTGFTSLLGDTESAVDEYDFATNSWKTLPATANIPTPRAGSAGVVIGNQLLVAGGESDANGAHPEVELFDPATGTWAELPQLVTGRHGTQPIVYKGSVYLAAGWGYLTETYADELTTQEFINLVDETSTIVPTISKPIPNISVKSDIIEKSINLKDYFADDKGAANLTYTVTRNSNSALVISTLITKGELALNFKGEKTGNSTLKIRATDADGFFIEDEFVVTILSPLPAAPKIGEPLKDRKIPVNTASIDLNLSDVFTDDMPFDSLELTITGISDSSIISKAVISGHDLVVSFPPNLLGKTDITIRAMDKDSLFAEDKLSIEIISKTKTAPSVKLPFTDLKQKLNFPGKSIDLTKIFSDDQNDLLYKITRNSNPALVAAEIDNDSLVLKITPELTGISEISIRATDGEGQYAEDNFKVLIYQPDSVPAFSIRINSGGDSVYKAGELWQSDKYFSGGETYSDPLTINGTDNQFIYQSERYGVFNYAVPVVKGLYNVKLHFAEIYWKEKGNRIFNADIENGADTLRKFDIIESAGGPLTAVIQSFDSINVADDTLNINFSGVLDNPKISAIEILSSKKIKLNNPPYVSLAIADQEMKFGEITKNVNIYKAFYDDDGISGLRLSVDYISDSSIISSAIIHGVALVLTTVPEKSGKVLVRLKATDPEGLTATEEFTLTINEPAPEPPVVHIPLPDISTGINTVLTPIILDSVFKDNRGPAQLKIGVKKNSNPAIVTSAVIKNGQLILTLGRNRTGTSTITMEATDIDGLFAEDKFVVTILPPDTVNTTTIRINSGGETELLNNQIWESDQYFNGGTAYKHEDSIRKGENSIFGTERFGSYSYNIPVTKGNYTVKLYFKELFWTSAGQRVFNVEVEGKQGRLNNYDIVKKAGTNKLVVQEFRDIQVNDSTLDISLSSVVNNASVSAIEVLSTPVIAARVARPDSSNLRVPATGSFRIYPNPVHTGPVSISLPPEYSGGKLELTIYNTNGALIYRIPEIRTQSRQVSLALPSGISKGTFLVKLRDEQRVYLSRLIVQ